MSKKQKATRGGIRKGAGRPSSGIKLKMYSFRLPVSLVDRITGNKSAFVTDAIRRKLDRTNDAV